MAIKNLPADLNAEVLLECYPKGTFDVELKGLHRRNAYMDILNLENRGERMLLSLGRNSLYNSLPEFLFHPIDRFDLPQYNQKERFAEEYVNQELEKEKAHKLFAPIDLALLHQRVRARRHINSLTSENKVLIDIISDCLTEEQKNNRFIKRSLEYLPYCKIIRGDRTLITMMLRKVLMEEGVVVEINNDNKIFADSSPRYNTEIDSDLSSLYVGTEFEQVTQCYNVYYWNEEECNDNFNSFLDDIEKYRLFVQNFFLSVESILEFNVCHDAPVLRLSDKAIYNYLNYNTNI